MEVDDSADENNKRQVVSPVNPPEPSAVNVSEDSGFENMDIDEPNGCNSHENKKKRPLELVSFFQKITCFIYYIINLFVCIIFLECCQRSISFCYYFKSFRYDLE